MNCRSDPLHLLDCSERIDTNYYPPRRIPADLRKSIVLPHSHNTAHPPSTNQARSRAGSPAPPQMHSCCSSPRSASPAQMPGTHSDPSPHLSLHLPSRPSIPVHHTHDTGSLHYPHNT